MTDQDQQDLARRILGGGPPKVDPDRHFDGCPARDGAPICSCGGNRATPADRLYTEELRKLGLPPRRDAGPTEVAAYYPAVAEYIRDLERRVPQGADPAVEAAAVRMAGRGMDNPRAVWDRWPESTRAHYRELAAAALGVTP